jgi:hypothetical protein
MSTGAFRHESLQTEGEESGKNEDLGRGRTAGLKAIHWTRHAKASDPYFHP